MSKKKLDKRTLNAGRKKLPLPEGLTPQRRRIAQRLRSKIKRGDAAKIAKACKVGIDTVYYWQSHGNTPAVHWPTIGRVLNDPDFAAMKL